MYAVLQSISAENYASKGWDHIHKSTFRQILLNCDLHGADHGRIVVNAHVSYESATGTPRDPLQYRFQPKLKETPLAILLIKTSESHSCIPCIPA